MPELREVYDMVTKQAPPKLDALARQHHRQQRNQRNRRVGAVAVVAVIAVVALAMVARMERPKDATPGGGVTTTTPAVDFIYDLESRVAAPLPASLVDGATFDVSPDGTQLAYTGEAENGTLQVFIANRDGTGVRQVTTDPLGMADPTWSPDGSMLTFSTVPDSAGLNAIYVMDVSSGDIRRVTDDDVSSSGPEFANDTTIVFSSWDTVRQNAFELRNVPAAGGTSTVLLREHGVNLGAPTASPNGNRIAFARNGRGATRASRGIWLAGVDGSDARILEPDPKGWIGAPQWSPDGFRIAYAAPSGPGLACPCTVMILDVGTGEATAAVTDVGSPDIAWLDAHTIIVEQH